MIWLLMNLALAQEPATWTATAEEAIPFTLTTAGTYGMRADRPDFTQGWLVRLTLPEGATERRAQITPAVHLGEWPARMVTPGGQACTVLWVPALQDLKATPVFLGPAVLPERLSADAARQAAADAGAAPRPFLAATGVDLALDKADDIWSHAEQMAARCPTPTD